MKGAANKSDYKLRRYAVLMVFVFAVTGLLWRALDMQVLNQAFFQQQGRKAFKSCHRAGASW